jgi:predicted phage tail protein
MRAIHLHGRLSAFGGPFSLDVATPREAVRALAVQLPGFRQAMSHGAFRLVRGQPDTGLAFDLAGLDFRLGNERELHIVPALRGAGRGGFGKIIMGAILIAAVFLTAGGAAVAAPTLAAGEAAATMGTGVAAASGLGATAFTAFGATVTYGNIAMLGAGMVLNGAASFLAGTPKAPSYSSFEPADQRASFLINSGVVNVAEQGHPVPVGFGIALVGSVVGSGGIAVEDI